jgi:hypothetical protein
VATVIAMGRPSNAANIGCALVVLLAAAAVVVGCGETTGRYGKFVSAGSAEDWEVWRHPDGRLFFRSGRNVRDRDSYSCADGDHRVVELDGTLVRDSVGHSGLVTIKPVAVRYASRSRAWIGLETNYFDRRQVNTALKDGRDRPEPAWADEVEHCDYTIKGRR